MSITRWMILDDAKAGMYSMQVQGIAAGYK